jgi:hypothetical protein
MTGKGDEPSPTITTAEGNELMEVESPTALSAPASMRVARAAMVSFFMDYNLRFATATFLHLWDAQ